MGKRILLVEDNDIHRLLTEDFLTYEGYEVLGLQDETQFFEAIATHEPNLILLDLSLPKIHGFCLLEQKQQSEWHTIPVIVVSAYAFEREKQKAYGLGVNRYLTKPISLKILAKVIETELLKLATYPAPFYTAANCQPLLN